MKGKDCLRVLTLTLVLGWCWCQRRLKVDVNMGGMTGFVQLEQSSEGQITRISYTGIPGEALFEIRQFWTDLTVESPCRDEFIGSRVHSNIGGVQLTNNEISGNVLPNLKTLSGRSLLLSHAGGKACGTFMTPSKSYTTALAKLEDTIFGTVWFRQAHEERTEVVVDLMQPGSSTSKSYDWKIYSGNGDMCKTFTSVFNPTSPGGGTCSPNNPNACAVGDLTGKFGTISLSATANRRFYQDLNLALSGNNTIVGQYIVVIDLSSNKIVSCSKLVAIVNKIAEAKFNKHGVQGRVTLIQASPFDATVIQVNLVGLNNTAGGYHIHQYPVPYQTTTSQDLCSASAVGGHWNPYSKAYPQPAGSTHDSYEIGDISGKFGLLNGKKDLFEDYNDFNMPLFGSNSVIGRSIVIHKNLPGAPRWLCSTLAAIDHRQAAIITFKRTVIGYVILSQEENSPSSEKDDYYR